jgi:LacI family transcriptional regulator
VAREAGVSKVTVSYVLNGRREAARISQATETKVVAVARELGYRPNGVARMLARSRTETLAVVFQHGQFFSVWSTFTSEVMRGVAEEAVRHGYDLLLHTRPSGTPEAEADALTDGRVDGLLVLRDSNDPTVEHLLRRGFPCVMFFTRPEDPDVPFVDADNFQGGRLATKHLVDLGHERIGIVCGSEGSVSSNARLEGYRAALREAALPVREEYLVRMPAPSSSVEPLERLLEREDRPTALFVWSDDVAFRCMKLLEGKGLGVPEDVSIVGFDSSAACEHSAPALTSVCQPVSEIACRATAMLVQRVSRRPLDTHHVIFPSRLDVRGSTAPPRGGRYS